MYRLCSWHANRECSNLEEGPRPIECRTVVVARWKESSITIYIVDNTCIYPCNCVSFFRSTLVTIVRSKISTFVLSPLDDASAAVYLANEADTRKTRMRVYIDEHANKKEEEELSDETSINGNERFRLLYSE